VITTYRIEIWNKVTSHYVVCWHGHSAEQAQIMMFKPYYKHNTRRLIRTDEEILYTEKGKK